MKSYTGHIKKWMPGVLVAVLFIALAIPILASDIKLTLDNKALQVAVAPIQEKGTTLVPLRVISENLGAKVDFQKKTQTVTITKGNDVISFIIGDTKAVVNGTMQHLTVPSKVVNGTTMVPLRFVSENLNCEVSWDSKTQTVSITSNPVTSTTLPIATIKVKDLGTITLELYPEMAPNTVNNFISLANSHFYDGLIFHRVIKDFMIQGGDPNGNGTGGPGYSIPGEFSSNGYTANTLSHTKGVISMARSISSPDSAGSQFFIMTGDATYLDGDYAAFGKVISGIDIALKIQVVDKDTSNKPLTNVVIESIQVDTKGVTFEEPAK